MLRLSMAQKGFFAVLILVLAELSFVSILTVELNTLRNRLETERQARVIVEHLNLFATAAQSAAQELLKALPFDREMRENFGFGSYKPQVVMIRRELRILAKELQNDPQRIKSIHKMEALATQMENSADYLLTLPRSELTQKKISSTYQTGTKLIGVCDEVMQTYENDERLSSGAEESLERVEAFLAVGIFIITAGNLVAIVFFVRRFAGRINIISENIARFARQETLLPEQNDTDEIGAIDKAFHDLADGLIEASEQERILIENATDVVCSIDTKGNFVSINRHAADQWGYDPEELIGESVEKTLMATSVLTHIEKWNYSSAEDANVNFEERVRKKDGVAIDTLWSVHWSASDGTFFSCVRDISETKHMDNIIAAQEEHLRNVIENMPIGIVTVDRNGTIKRTNRVGMDLLHMHVDNSVLDGRAITDFLNTGRGADALFDIGTSTSIRVSLTSQNQEQRFVDVTSVRSLGRKNEVLVLLDDATERHVLEQMKKNLVSLLGNNLRDPLVYVKETIRGLIDRKALDEARQVRLKRIDLNLKRLLSLLEQLLNVEQLGIGKLIGELRSCCLQDIITEAVEATKDYAEQQRINLIWDRSPTPIGIAADAQRLVQVIINLIGNAVKYSPPNSTVSLSVHQGASEVEVKISDEGRGVPEHMRESIFQPFVQTESSDGRRGAGTGLGLSICRQIIESHGGTIGVDAREGTKGSIFWIKLPTVRTDFDQ